MATLVYPNPFKLVEIEQDLVPTLIGADPIDDIFPEEASDTPDLIWEQMDNFTGLMQGRGLNGMPPQVKPVGIKQFTQAPGAYGEFSTIDEVAMTNRRKYGTAAEVIDVSDLVQERQQQLIVRDWNRRRKMGWDLLTTGAYSASDAKGTVVHSIQYTPRAYNAAVSWATFATATPLADFRAVGLLGRGSSTAFDAGAKAYANQATINNMLSNTNSADIFGRRTQGLGTLNTLGLVNQLFLGENTPALTPYDQGYIDDTGTFQLFIPNGKVVVVGRRYSGFKIGALRMVRNANNPNMEPGVYYRAFDKQIDSNGPRTVEIHRGWSGGCLMMMPRAVILMNV